MQEQNIEAYLAELGSELQNMGLKDVDDPTNSPLYQSFKSAARTVARYHRIPLTWINDVIGDFLRDATNVPQGTLWRSYGPLEIYKSTF
jgi:hypothetical protein